MTLQTQRPKKFAQIAQLYRERMKKDFARNELKPLWAIRRAWKQGVYDCYGLMDGNEVLGYAFFVRQGENRLFDYLAIAEQHRREGLGSIFLRQLTECLQTAGCVVGEVEAPDKAADEATRLLRERRMQFYLRNGYRKTEVTSKVFGVD